LGREGEKGRWSKSGVQHALGGDTGRMKTGVCRGIHHRENKWKAKLSERERERTRNPRGRKKVDRRRNFCKKRRKGDSKGVRTQEKRKKRKKRGSTEGERGRNGGEIEKWVQFPLNDGCGIW